MGAIDDLIAGTKSTPASGGSSAPSGGSAIDRLVSAPPPVKPKPLQAPASAPKVDMTMKPKMVNNLAPRPASSILKPFGGVPPTPETSVQKPPSILNGVKKAFDAVMKFSKGDPDKNFEMQEVLRSGNAKIVETPEGRKMTTPALEAYKTAAPDEKVRMQKEQELNTPILKFLNSPTGRKVTETVYKNTSNLPLKAIASIQAMGDKTYDEAYQALLAKSKDPENPAWQRILYGVQDSGVQSAIGALLAVGTSYVTRNPNVGRAVATSYFAPIAAESQRQDNPEGNVTSAGNIAIDTIGDTIITGFAENALKNIIKEGGKATLRTVGTNVAKGFAVEGGTEPTQTLLKYANDYRNAKTDAERAAIVQKTAEYVKSGGMLEEFLIAGISGAGITGIATGAGVVAGKSGVQVDPSLIPPQGPEGGAVPPPEAPPGAPAAAVVPPTAPVAAIPPVAPPVAPVVPEVPATVAIPPVGGPVQAPPPTAAITAIASYKMDPGGPDERAQMAYDILDALDNNPEEANKLADLSRKALEPYIGQTIYRAGDKNGISWTLDEDVAKRMTEGGQREVISQTLTPELLNQVIFFDGVSEKELGIKWKDFEDTFPFQAEDEIFIRSSVPQADDIRERIAQAEKELKKSDNTLEQMEIEDRLESLRARLATLESRPPVKQPTQKERVAETVKEGPKHIKEIAKETGILEPNVRRILGVGAKDGSFERVAEGVYTIKVGDKDVAWIIPGDALETLPKLAAEGFKADMVFLDIPYDAAGNRGGNRMNEKKDTLFETITPDQFGDKIVGSVNTILRNEDSPVVYMFSQSKSSEKTMAPYTQKLIDAGYIPLAKGDYYKMSSKGTRLTMPMRPDPLPPEGIIIFNRTGKYNFKQEPNLQFKLVRPRGYQTEKPAELLKSLIEMTTEEGDVVLDPFAGSGVTPAEAVKAGRSAIAIEKKPGQAEVIAARVQKAADEVKQTLGTKPRILTVKPEDTTVQVKEETERRIREGQGSASAIPEIAKRDAAKDVRENVTIAGKKLPRPSQVISKSDLRAMLKDMPDQKVEFTVIEKDGKKLMSWERRGSTMLLRPSALGLVEENINVGDVVKISYQDLLEKGTSFRALGEDGTVEASLASDLSDGGVDPAKTVDEMKQRIEQLNKFGQSYAILRRTGGLSKKAAGVFRSIPKDMQESKQEFMAKKGISARGQVHLQDEVVKNARAYMSTLSHELGHALEYTLVGQTNKDTYRVFGRNLDAETKATIRNELKAITNDMVGEENAKKGAGYYYKNTELLARFLQRMFEKPGTMGEIAPTALAHLELSAIETPIIAEYLEAVYGTIDKGERKHIFLRDMKQTYQKLLGTRVGAMAWNDEMRYRAMKERAKVMVENLISSRFKGVKDAPELLFRAAESIKVTRGGEPEYGTRDFKSAENDKEIAQLLAAGYEIISSEDGKPAFEIVDGRPQIRLAKQRYSPQQARALFDSLSPEGQQLIKDFTAARDEAKDYFNREAIKDAHKITSDLEGWVHHYWDEKGTGLGGDRLKMKRAAATKFRAGAEGYVEDLQKAMTKALTELETTKAYNDFIEDYFARVSEPIAKGEQPKEGYVEVQGNVKKGGVGRPGEIRTTIIQNGKSFVAEKTRYQMPAVIYARYKLISEVAVEAGTAIRVMNSINRYWRINILFHPGSAATNFISGGLQYSTKILTDFYTEVLTGNVTLPKTRRNIFSMFTVLTPKGWQSAPDWIYGGDLSNFYGQFGQEKSPGIKALDTNIDAYADRALKVYGLVERYWKKVIAISENVGELEKLNQLDASGLRLPTDDEKAMLDEINEEIDLFAYDYENVPMWLENHQQSALGQSVKPFLKYPYKYAKQITEMVGAAFDRTLPWEERLAKVLALGTMIAIYAWLRERRKKEQKTPEVDETAPAQVSTRGRFFIGTDEQGNEMFTRTAKYPFINITEAASQFLEGNTNTGAQALQDMLGSIAPVGDIGAALMGYSNQYQQYTPIETRLGDAAASFVPGTRILQDIARFFDPFQRKKQGFLQSFTSLIPIPTDNEALREKLRGEIRTIRVPIEGTISGSPEEGERRTTTDMFVRNYKGDVLKGLLGGIYITRIDPDVAAAFVERKKINEEKKAEKAEEE